MNFDMLISPSPANITDLKWIFSNVKLNSESIDGVFFPHTVSLTLSWCKKTVRLRRYGLM